MIPTNGFYEFKGEKGHKQKFLFTEPNQEMTFIAGICKYYPDCEDGIFPYRFTMITTVPSKSFSEYHHREPVLIRKEECEQWLKATDIDTFLRRIPFELNIIPVSA